MKNNNLNPLPLSVLLVFVCADVRVTSQILLDIITESNASMGCFQLMDYKSRPNGTVEQFSIKLSYEDLAGMLTRFAWLMRDINNDSGYAFWLKSTEMQLTEIHKEVLNAYRNENGEVVKATVVTNSTFTKIKRKKWGH